MSLTDECYAVTCRNVTVATKIWMHKNRDAAKSIIELVGLCMSNEGAEASRKAQGSQIEQFALLQRSADGAMKHVPEPIGHAWCIAYHAADFLVRKFITNPSPIEVLYGDRNDTRERDEDAGGQVDIEGPDQTGDEALE